MWLRLRAERAGVEVELVQVEAEPFYSELNSFSPRAELARLKVEPGQVRSELAFQFGELAQPGRELVGRRGERAEDRRVLAKVQGE